MKPKKALLFTALLATTLYCVGQSILQDNRVEQFKTGFKFAEGAVADRDGNLYFSDLLDDKIYQLTTEGELSVFLSEVWGNGLAISDGYLYVCQTKARQISRYALGHKTQEILATTYNGKPFNGPNDLWVMDDGGVYFSDPNYSNKADAQQEVVYYIDPTGNVSIAADDLVRPNGLTFDGRYLYVLDQGDNRTWKYRINKEGQLKGKRHFVRQSGDGATSDSEGNIYLTNLQESSVDVYDSEGILLVKLPIPKIPSNVAFAGKNHDELYITARSSIYRVLMTVKGSKVP